MAGWAALCFAIAFAGTWLARRYALRVALVDHPGDRRSHSTPTPRGGGIAIVAAVLPVVVLVAVRDPGMTPLMASVAAGLLLVAAIGWIDDHRPLSPALRLVVHAAAAALLAQGLLASGASSGMAASAFLAVLVLVNVWNFMDGIDALAASQAAVVALGYAALAGGGPVAWLGIALAAACLGFLPFNLPRARIFLGDVGSGALGYLLAVLAALLLVQLRWERSPLLLYPLAAFGVDAALTLARRVLRGERWWQPHVDHAYQRQARTHGHGPVAAAFLVWTIVEAGFMLVLEDRSPLAIMCGAAVSAVLASAAWRWLQATEGSRDGGGA